MKAKKTRLVLMASLLTTAGAAWAGWSAPVKITGYYVYDNGNAYLTTTNNQNTAGCADNRYIALDAAASNFKAIWAQVIAAHATGSMVSVLTNGCSGSYPKAMAIAVPNVS